MVFLHHVLILLSLSHYLSLSIYLSLYLSTLSLSHLSLYLSRTLDHTPPPPPLCLPHFVSDLEFSALLLPPLQ